MTSLSSCHHALHQERLWTHKILRWHCSSFNPSCCSYHSHSEKFQHVCLARLGKLLFYTMIKCIVLSDSLRIKASWWALLNLREHKLMILVSSVVIQEHFKDYKSLELCRAAQTVEQFQPRYHSVCLLLRNSCRHKCLKTCKLSQLVL